MIEELEKIHFQYFKETHSIFMNFYMILHEGISHIYTNHRDQFTVKILVEINDMNERKHVLVKMEIVKHRLDWLNNCNKVVQERN